MKINYFAETEKIVESLSSRPSLLLHACCAPCSTSVLEYLIAHFKVTVFYYNPNTYPKSEYLLRLDTLKRLLSFPEFNGVNLLTGEYDENEFSIVTEGLENENEGGARCTKCFRLRLEKTAETAKRLNFNFFTTTLTVSPHKNADLINRIGFEVAEKYKATFLPSDFKKHDGYLRSIRLSEKYDLYRQNYCGCKYSLAKDTDSEQKSE